MVTKGILGEKLGMTQVYDEDHNAVPVTVIQAGPCTVTQVKTLDNDGYNALQLAFGSRRNLNKPTRGHLNKAGVGSARTLAEVRTDQLLDLGTNVTCEAFVKGELVDVVGRSKGKGFAGVMKRHHFAGMGDGHGVKRKNRHPGAVGMCATPGRTFPGKPMAGRMGGNRVTIQNLEVIDVEAERNLLLIKGAVPGSNGDVVFIQDAVKHPAETGWNLPAPEETPENDEAGDGADEDQESDVS